jgi:hypothetical protein
LDEYHVIISHHFIGSSIAGWVDMGLYRDRPSKFLSFFDLLRNLFIERTTCVMQLEHTNSVPSFLVAKNKDLCAGQHTSVLRIILAPRDSYHVMRPFARGCFRPCAWCRLSIFTRNFCSRRSTSAIPFGRARGWGHQAYHVAAKRRSEGSSLRPGRREQPRARPGGAAVNRDDGCGVGRWERHAMLRCDWGRSAAEVAQIVRGVAWGKPWTGHSFPTGARAPTPTATALPAVDIFAPAADVFALTCREAWRDRFNSPV